MADDERDTSALDTGFQLGNWKIDPKLNRIRCGGSAVHLEPKHMDVLVYLAGQPGEVKGKNEILGAVWPQQFVAESVLTRAIAELRRALGDDARDPRFIETIPRRGYCLIAPVRVGMEGSRLPRLMIVLAVAAATFWALSLFVSHWTDPGSKVGTEPDMLRSIPSQLTDSPAVEIYPTFSPDGTSLAYSSNASGEYEIYVRQLVARGSVRRLTDDGLINLQPAWSPDGSRIAYHSIEQGGIWVIPSRGGAPRRLSEFGSSPCWSPDGKEIVFQSTEVFGLISGSAMPPATLWRVKVGGGRPEHLTRPGDPIGGHGSPSYTADGRSVVFQSGDFGIPGGLWRLSLGEHHITRIGDVATARYPVADPDGRSIYYTAGFQRQLWLFRIDLQSDGRFSPPLRILQTGGLHLAVSPDGRRLAMSVVEDSSHLWSVPIDPESSDRAGDVERLNEATNSRNTLPSISPDGSTVAFHGFYPGRRTVLYLMDLATRRQTELVEGTWAKWSEDGKALHFWSRGGLHRIRLSTREVEWVVPVPLNMGAVRLSPDDTRFAYHRADEAGVTNIWISDLLGENERRVTSDEEFAGFPLWSPNGDQLAYEIDRGGNTQTALIDLGSGRVEQLTHRPGLSWPEGWSPDGDKIAFAGFRDGVWNIYWVSRSTGEERRLTDFGTGIETFVRWPAWSPTGDRIVFERYEASADLWLVDLR